MMIGEIDVSEYHTIIIDGVKFSIDLLRQMVPESGERTWEVRYEDGEVRKGKFARTGCVVIIATDSVSKTG